MVCLSFEFLTQCKHHIASLKKLINNNYGNKMIF